MTIVPKAVFYAVLSFGTVLLLLLICAYYGHIVSISIDQPCAVSLDLDCSQARSCHCNKAMLIYGVLLKITNEYVVTNKTLSISTTGDISKQLFGIGMLHQDIPAYFARRSIYDSDKAPGGPATIFQHNDLHIMPFAKAYDSAYFSISNGCVLTVRYRDYGLARCSTNRLLLRDMIRRTF